MLSVAAWLAPLDASAIATSGKPDCYKSMQTGTEAGTHLCDEDNFRTLISHFGYSPPCLRRLKKDKRWLKVIIATTPYI